MHTHMDIQPTHATPHTTHTPDDAIMIHAIHTHYLAADNVEQLEVTTADNFEQLEVTTADDLKLLQVTTADDLKLLQIHSI